MKTNKFPRRETFSSKGLDKLVLQELKNFKILKEYQDIRLMSFGFSNNDATIQESSLEKSGSINNLNNSSSSQSKNVALQTIPANSCLNLTLSLMTSNKTEESISNDDSSEKDSY